jgi:abortive infection bacteriophage resistance protein
MFPHLNLPKKNHIFKVNTTFQSVLNLYKFDKKLRLLIFNEIEKIEIAVRSSIVSNACEFFNDPYWITDSKYFMSPNKFQKTLSLIDKELEHSKEDFIIHFRSKYSDTYPPAWILAEILSLGTLMNVYYNLRDITVQKKIAKEFGLQVKPFESWMSIVTLTRNACCHHSRIWNKQNTMLATEPKHITKPWIKLPTDKLRIYFDICIIKWFLDCISPNNTLRDKICKLLAEYPCIDISAMGFPTDWLKEELWKG